MRRLTLGLDRRARGRNREPQRVLKTLHDILELAFRRGAALRDGLAARGGALATQGKSER
jgi:hypothetical protein